MMPHRGDGERFADEGNSMNRLSLGIILLFLATLAGGCARKNLTLTTAPPDALLRIDGEDVGPGPIARQFKFTRRQPTHTISASRKGFKDQTVELTRDFLGDSLRIDLKPESRRITIQVAPVQAIIKIDAEEISRTPTALISRQIEFGVDAQNRWKPHVVTAERPGFKMARAVVSFDDPSPTVLLQLEPMRKSFTVSTDPSGAEVFLDDRSLGTSPVKVENEPFPVRLDNNESIPRTLRVIKPGYPEVRRQIAWDEGQSHYTVSLSVRTKDVRILTDPPRATVAIDEAQVRTDEDGHVVATLEFPPIAPTGELKTYTAAISKKTDSTEWEPKAMVIGWDDGQSEYSVKLREVLTRTVASVEPELVRGEDGWSVVPRARTWVAMKELTEGPGRPSPVQVTQLPAGTIIDSLTISPDASQLLFVVLQGGRGAEELRSQLRLVRADGSGGEQLLTDFKALDLTPAFSPDGKSIVFSSNRAGKRLSIWQLSVAGAPGVTQLTLGLTTDLWPCMDSDPQQPRLFYEARTDGRAAPRIYMTRLGTTIRTDLSALGGAQPRISPKGDALLFTVVNERSGKRDIYRMSDRGERPENLTNTPEVDEFDPAWSADAGRIAYASEPPPDATGAPNRDVWMMDMTRRDAPTRLTANASADDCPAWDPAGEAIYFRSNRGGEWAIWRIGLK